MVLYVVVAQELSAVCEALLHEESHAHDLRPRLAAEVYDAARGVSFGEEIVDEQYAVVFREEFAVDAHRSLVASRERPYPRLPRLVDGLWVLLLDKDDGEVHEVSSHDGRCNARGFDSNNLVDALVLEEACKFLCAVHHEFRVELVVEETAYEYDASVGFGASFRQDALFEFVHHCWVGCFWLFLRAKI